MLCDVMQSHLVSALHGQVENKEEAQRVENAAQQTGDKGLAVEEQIALAGLIQHGDLDGCFIRHILLEDSHSQNRQRREDDVVNRNENGVVKRLQRTKFVNSSHKRKHMTLTCADQAL